MKIRILVVFFKFNLNFQNMSFDLPFFFINYLFFISNIEKIIGYDSNYVRKMSI